MNSSRSCRTLRQWLQGHAQALGAIALAIAVSGCATTQSAKPVLKGGRCVFLEPAVCALLTPGTKDGAALRYIAPNVDWQQYTRVMITPVLVFGNAEKKLPPAESQALADYFHSTLVNAVGKDFKIVDRPGKDVMKLRVALTDASAAVPVLRTVSMVVPQARALATLKYIVTGTYAFVGGAQGEEELTDAMTGQVLAAAVDHRVGGGSLKTATVWQWGDAKNVMDEWANVTAQRLESLHKTGSID